MQFKKFKIKKEDLELYPSFLFLLLITYFSMVTNYKILK